MDDFEEVERLARKAWPDERRLNIVLGYDSEVTDEFGCTLARVAQHDRAPEALLATLRVLVGENGMNREPKDGTK